MSTPLAQNSVAIRAYRGEPDFAGLVAFIAMQFEHEREQQDIPRLHGGKVAPQYALELVETVNKREGCLLFAEVGANPIGFIAAYRLSDPDPVLEDKARDHGYVRDLFVLPNWRRMSVGSRLVEAAETHFRNMGVTRIRIAGPAQNEAMVSLCRASNFKAYATVFERVIPMPSHAVVDGKIMKGARS
jgi:ribosomal protein S18 acetylase RimI-like enzyme